MKQLFTILFLILNSVLFAQSNYQKGYIIKNNGDTVNGFINAKEWALSPKYVDFKTTITENKSTRFYPQSLKGFKVEEGYSFISYIGVISLNRVKTTEITNVLDTSKKVDSLFLKKIAFGTNLNLYFQQDGIKVRYFIGEPNDKPVELLYLVSFNESNDPVISPIYKAQLMFYENKIKPDNRRVINLIEESNYNQDDLEAIVNKLNNNTVISNFKVLHDFYLGIGINYITTTILDLSKTGITPTIDFGMDFYNNRKKNRFVFSGDIAFAYLNYDNNQFQTADKYYNILYNVINPTEEYTLNQYSIIFTLKAKYNFVNNDRFKFFVSLGLGYNYSTYTNNKLSYYTTYSKFDPIINPYEYVNFYGSLPIGVGFIFGKRIGLDLTYLNAVFTPSTLVDATKDVKSFVLKYYFPK